MMAGLCHFVISFYILFAWHYCAAPRRNNAKRKDEITKKKMPSEIIKRRSDARRKNEKTSCATPNDEKRARIRKNVMRNNAILNSYFLSFRLASFCHFIFFRLVLFRPFVILCGVFLLFLLFPWRYFVFLPCHNSKQNDKKMKKCHTRRQNYEKTPLEKTK